MGLPGQPYAWIPPEPEKPRESGVFSNTNHNLASNDRRSAVRSALHNMDHAGRFIAKAQNDLLAIRARMDHNRLERLHRSLRELIAQYEDLFKKMDD